MKIFYLICFLIFVSLQYSLLVGNNSIFTYMNLNNKLRDYNTQLLDYKNKNKYLKSEIKNLKNNNNSLETYAREKFGFIKKNETFFQIIRNEK
jgi:cell division protein FtsB